VLLTEMGKITRDIESKQYGFGRSHVYYTLTSRICNPGSATLLHKSHGVKKDWCQANL
jgi:hypothetical protein